MIIVIIPKWLESSITNKEIKAYNGNINQGNNMKFVLWNKGNSYLENTMLHEGVPR